MKNIVENQDIKTDKPLPMSYEALKAERDALAVESAGFKHALSVILEHVDVTDKGRPGVVAMIANDELFNSETPATEAALAAIKKQAGIEAVEEAAYSLYGKGYIFDTIMDYATELREAK